MLGAGMPPVTGLVLGVEERVVLSLVLMYDQARDAQVNGEGHRETQQHQYPYRGVDCYSGIELPWALLCLMQSHC